MKLIGKYQGSKKSVTVNAYSISVKAIYKKQHINLFTYFLQWSWLECIVLFILLKSL